jgi:hypothetical protein
MNDSGKNDVTRATHHGSWSTLGAAALVALCLSAATGCAIDGAPAGGTGVAATPSPSASPAASPAAATPTSPWTAPGAAPVSPQNPSGTGETVSIPIDNSAGGSVALPDGTRLDIPAGALPPGVDTITVTSSTTGAPAEYSSLTPLFVFGPDGTVFLSPIAVSVPVAVSAGTDISGLTILWSRASGAGFDMLPTTFAPVAGSSTQYTATASVTHFSRGFCGAKFSTDPHPSKDPYME